ncbi:hypothetical protein Kpol_1050p88 [Vanderwaltozyma polyspora DSM 70294]|uniref:Peptidase M16 N-terminal domain-containing protein n=1 Tax=Vanderwaltozyma polyspora (strain ATCC 22028 / DSM 70294 / BCRC 21397 / CBS 2163 / NBRC 10782 / NRRL Y-8283 / UCD 57-17) TaxID=436907 RepID=A7TEY2_VANPO|nr:uncharacterized protein Kpol_1050p88 [Vanderwaltozyma polyspora DSM 70294]EDO19228.1 hypothetical protein Kpol_1050p88 [Vanderwaltozyma polyspora DSM 70294]
MSWSEVKNYDIPFYTPISYRGRTNKLCRLPNGMLVLLISDPGESSFGCSLSVATGSHNDPKEIPGLAHLCEHMILAAGSKKYPNPGLYHELIAKNKGLQNAYTTGEQTTFYFELPNVNQTSTPVFEDIIDVFASFFKDPLFNQTLTSKEIYAIESEHTGNTSNPTKIFYHAERLLANSNHPFSHFSTGNINTLSSGPQLRKINLKSLLDSYFKVNFKAENMTLCIKGPQSVNILTKIAIRYFSDIKGLNSIKKPKRFGTIRKSISTSEKSIPLSPSSPTSCKSISSVLSETNSSLLSTKILENVWSPKYNNMVCFDPKPKYNTIIVKSNKKPVLRLVFPVVTNKGKFSKEELITFCNLWCETLGDESENSICNILMNEEYITDILAFTSDFALNNIGLILEFSLTDKGLNNVSHIINSIMESAIPKLSKEYTEELARFLSECDSIDLLNFLHKESELSPMEECSDLSGLMQTDLDILKPECLFKQSPMIVGNKYPTIGNFGESSESRQWWLNKATMYQEFLEMYMNKDLLRIALLCDFSEKQYFGKNVSEQKLVTDTFYEFDYIKLSVLPEKVPEDQVDIFSNLKFPAKNEYIPELGRSLLYLREMLKKVSYESRSPILSLTTPSKATRPIPKLAEKGDMYEMWVMEDKFRPSTEKKTIVTFDLLSLDVPPTPKNTMHLEILGQILYVLLSPKLYPSLKLGYTYEIASSSKGDVRLSFTLSGYSDGLTEVVKTVIKTCFTIAIDDEIPSKRLLRRARILTRRKYESAAAENCAKLASVGLIIMLEKYIWPLEDRLNALEESDIHSFKEFCIAFLRSKKYLNLIVQGNLKCANEINKYLNDSFTNHLGEKSGKNTKSVDCSKTTKLLEPGTNCIFEHFGHPDDPNNCIVYFIQTGKRDDKKALALTSFTEYLLSLTLVPDLRNKKQIGYVVFGGMRVLSDTVGIHITVMSGSNPLDLEEKIDEYLYFLESEVLKKLSEEQFGKKFVKDYLSTMGGDSTGDMMSTAGPPNVLDGIAANVQAGDFSVLNSLQMITHRRIKNEITSKRYNFSNDDIETDLNFIKHLTLKKYLKFFEENISISSVNRSKLSVAITSPMATQEIMNRKFFLQLEGFLKLNGFTINNDTLKSMVSESQGRPGKLFKLLFNYFSNRGEGWKFCKIVTSEVLKIIAISVKPNFSGIFPSSKQSDSSNIQTWSSSVKPAITLTKVNDVHIFKV